MKTKLTVLREQNERSRFQRLGIDDSRTAIKPEDVKSLESMLKRSIDGEVRFDKGSRALYATDGSNYRQVPIGVVIPRHVGDVETTIRLAREHDAPILSRGGGTSLAGQCCNVAVVIDFSKYMFHVLRIDKEDKIGYVEPGCVLDHFRETAKSEAGLFFGPDPATHDHCTIGGMLGNNSCGSHSLLSKKHGLGVRMSDNTVIGSTRFFNLEYWGWPTGHPSHGRSAPDACEIGYTWYAASAIRTPANTEAKLLMLAYAFEDWKVLRVCLHTDVRNARSRAAIERIGGKFEGTLRAHRIAADFIPRDSARYSIIAAEWLGVKEKLVQMRDRKYA